ncbi:unnamed protein product [Somion occarium]|uniref:Uncharacterized protein n=1 Tax=Somion occarium TaxID=3059160 RepID=A0ABP1E5J8_9APHY
MEPIGQNGHTDQHENQACSSTVITEKGPSHCDEISESPLTSLSLSHDNSHDISKLPGCYNVRGKMPEVLTPHRDFCECERQSSDAFRQDLRPTKHLSECVPAIAASIRYANSGLV